jgi:dipeptidyl aminopeptidase/acylaminoacyl peptidase
MNNRILLFLFLLFSQKIMSQTEILTPETLWKLGRVGLESVSPDGQSVIYGVTRYDLSTNKSWRNLFICQIKNGKVTQLTNDESSCANAIFRPDGLRIGYLRDDKMWEMNLDGTDARQVNDLDMGGFKYAPDGSKILFTQELKMEATAAENNPDLPKTTGRVMDGLMYRHWKSWSDGKYSNIFIADYQDGKLRGELRNIMNQPFDSPMKPFGGMEQITWSPDGRFVLYTCKKLAGTAAATSTNSDIFAYEIKSGKTVNLSEGLLGYDIDPVFSPTGQYLAWTSMETPGYEADRSRLMLFDLATSQRTELTEGWNFEANHPVFAPDGKSLYFISSKKSTYHLFQIDISTKKITQITDGIFNLEAFQVVDNQTVIAQKVAMNQPSELVSIATKSGKVTPISEINTAIWSKIKHAKIEQRTIKTIDGKDMLVWLILPPDFDAKKQYPSILFCQGGPQSPLSQGFSYRWNFDLMAAQGYVVIAPVRRGCPGNGQEWTDAIGGDWGGLAMQDLLSAADYMKKEPFIDKNAMGAAGASFGGYSVYWLEGNHEKRFKAFISHCGMYNMESWYGVTEELFFANHDLGGPYWSSKPGETWQKDSPHKYVQNWDTPLLVIHNEKDFRVPIGEGMQAFQAAQLRGIPSKFLYFPDEGHWMSQPQNAVLWQRTFFDWMDKYLKKKEGQKP